MALPNIFDPQVANEIIARLQKIQPQSHPLWGKMNAAQMMAHCCVTYEYVFEPHKHPKPGIFMQFILKSMVKKSVVSEKTYQQNLRTGPDFLVKPEQNFDAEKQRLIAYIRRVAELGAAHFEGKESHSFGKLHAEEWNNMFYKHLDHHLRQFGV